MAILKRIGFCLSAIAILGMSDRAIAQELVDLGRNSNGIPVFLQQESPVSTNFKIVQEYGDGILYSSFSAGCKNRNVFYKSLALYNAAGLRTQNFVYNKTVVPPQKSFPSVSLALVCRNLGATDW